MLTLKCISNIYTAKYFKMSFLADLGREWKYYSSFLISTWNQAVFQTHFFYYSRRSIGTDWSQYQSIICFLLVRNQNNPTKGLESEQNEFESRFGFKLRPGLTCTISTIVRSVIAFWNTNRTFKAKVFSDLTLVKTVTGLSRLPAHLWKIPVSEIFHHNFSIMRNSAELIMIRSKCASMKTPIQQTIRV